MLSTGVHFPICCRQYIEKRLLAAGLLLNKTAKHLPQFIPALGVPKGSDRLASQYVESCFQFGSSHSYSNDSGSAVDRMFTEV